MKAGLIAMLGVLLLAGSARADMPKVRYSCDDGTRLVASFRNSSKGPGAVVLVFPGSKMRTVLPQGLSADGGRYAAGRMQFWIKGRQATLTRAGRDVTCHAAS